MKLPNADSAVIDLKKLRDYCLNLEHPRGKHKARVFRSMLGITQNDAETLKKKILEGITDNNCLIGESDIYGTRYSLDLPVDVNGRDALVRTTWIVKNKEDFPRLTSCYKCK